MRIGVLDQRNFVLSVPSPHKKDNTFVMTGNVSNDMIGETFPVTLVMRVRLSCKHSECNIKHQDPLLGPFAQRSRGIFVVRYFEVSLDFLKNVSQRWGVLLPVLHAKAHSLSLTRVDIRVLFKKKIKKKTKVSKYVS